MKTVLALTVLVLALASAGAAAAFSTPPTFDLTTSSTVAGATNAAYTLFGQNNDPIENVASASITIPAGYSIGQQFITNSPGITVASVTGECQDLGTGTGSVVTTSTASQFALVVDGNTLGTITISQPTTTTQGQMIISFSGQFGSDDHGCYGSFVMTEGFFINPSAPGVYSWSPSSAQPVGGGSSVIMAARAGFSQNVTITVGATPTPEFHGDALLLFLALLSTMIVLSLRRKPRP